MEEKMKNINKINKSVVEDDQKIETLDQFEERLKGLRQRVLDKAGDVLGEKEGLDWWDDESFPFSHKILGEIEESNVKSYISWHVLSSSSVLGDDRKIFKNKDFLGEFSVESFYESLLKKLDEIEENKK
jgi:hypothetical protein